MTEVPAQSADPRADQQPEPLAQPLVWVDLEMSGLDPGREVILELAVIVTDGALEQVHEGPDIVIGAPDDVLSRMDPVVVDMHRRSGLTDAVRASTTTVAAAEAEALAFVRRLVPVARTAPLAGNSVHADRAFLQRYMPSLEAHLHYRNVDVSTVKELAQRWHPEAVATAPAKVGGHRALTDIRESIEELRHYRRTIFRQ
jgi:oligoribonuclease